MADFRETRPHVARHPEYQRVESPADRIPVRRRRAGCEILHIGGGKGRAHQECRMVDIHGEAGQRSEFPGVGGPDLGRALNLGGCFPQEPSIVG